MSEQLATCSSAAQLRVAATQIANEFVRRHVAADATAGERVRSREPFELAIATVTMCAEVLDGEPARAETAAETAQHVSEGARLALQGAPLSVAVTWLRELERMVTDRLASVVGATELSRVRALFDRLCAVQLESYERTNEELTGWSSRIGRDLLTCLASGAPIDPHTVNSQARVLNIDPHQPFRAVAVLVDPDSGESAWTRVRRRVMETLRRYDPQGETVTTECNEMLLALVPVQRPGAGIVAMMNGLLEDEELSGTATVSIGEPADSLASSGRTCRQALSALEIAVYRGYRGHVTKCTDVVLDVLLAHNRWVCHRMVDTRLGELLEKQHLLDTLRAYVAAEMSFQRTAEILVVHPNTVAYRLKQIAQITGRDLRKVTAIVDLANALTALDVLQMKADEERAGIDLRARLLA